MLPLLTSGRTTKILGRIVVHDRVEVEGKVLPLYFNHSSFASLRRQLNYFSFIRLGKGRQRESTYINEKVIELEDILHLKRRTASGNTVQANPKELSGLATLCSQGSAKWSEGQIAESSDSSRMSTLEHSPKRRRSTTETVPTTISPRSDSPVESYPISEDDENSHRNQVIVLDLTKPDQKGDADFLAGCKNLLCLATKRWE
jgi:HSF-type DNA-binding